MTNPTHANRQARERALELLYESEAKGVHPAEVVAAQPIAPVEYGAMLALGVGDHRELLDAVIGGRAKGWTVARMPAVDRALLRLATFELAFLSTQSIGIVIDEAVELARRFSTDGSPKFVNGVLAKVATDVRDGGRWASVSAPRVLVLDMDGVLRHWDEGAIQRGDAALGLEPGTLAGIALEPELLRRATLGELTDEVWRAEVATRVAERHGCDPEQVAALWLGDSFTIDDAVLVLARAVRDAGHPTACFSNATTRLEADIESVEIGDAFGVVVNSSSIGLAKPDPAAFVAAAGVIGAGVSDCLFVDDRAENVLGALEAGMPAVRFHGADRLRAVLERTALLPAG